MENPSGKKKDKSAASSGEQKVDLSPHPVVQKLMDPSGRLPEVVTLVGYLGPSDREDFIRLYRDLDFKSYFEIPKEGAILYRMPSDPSDEASPTKIVVRATARIEYVRVFEHAAEASFLQGRIKLAAPVAAPRRFVEFHTVICEHDASTVSTH